MDQRKRGAARVYAYVACSRFESRVGCHLYGKMRRSDFLPVGEDLEHQVLTRAEDSDSGLSADSEGYAPHLSMQMDSQVEYDFEDEQLQDDHGGICNDFDVGVSAASEVHVNADMGQHAEYDFCSAAQASDGPDFL